MEFVILAVSVVCGIGSLICWVLTLIKMFKSSVLTGILGIICGIYALYWSFKNRDAAGLGKVPTYWGIFVLVNLVLNFAMKGMAGE